MGSYSTDRAAWCRNRQTGIGVENTYRLFKAGRLNQDEIASAREVQLFSLTFAKKYWRSHSVYIQKRTRNLDVEDLYAVILEAVAYGICKYDKRRSPCLLSWLTLEAVTACRKHIKANLEGSRYMQQKYGLEVYSTEELHDDEDLRPWYASEEDPREGIHQKEIEEALAQLTRMQREILSLYYLGSLSDNQIAKRLWPGSPPNRSTVMRKRQQAESRLRELLTE